MRKLHAFGDSFVSGDQDDFLHDLEGTGIVANHTMGYDERDNYLKYNVSFVSHIAKELDLELINYSMRGSGNIPQLDKLVRAVLKGEIDKDDIIFFCFSTFLRDRVQLYRLSDQFIGAGKGPMLADEKAIQCSSFRNEIELIDCFNVLSTLDSISSRLGIRTIKCHAFDNSLDFVDDSFRTKYNFNDYVGWDVRGNTLIDILNGTWGGGGKHQLHHDATMPANLSHLYTRKNHPSVEGHQKIAKWFIDNVF